MVGKIFQNLLSYLRIPKILNNHSDELRELASGQSEILKALSFNSTIVDSYWLKYKSFSPGGWAVDYGFLYTLYRVLNTMKPSSVIEFGLGQSSKLIHQYAKYFSVQATTYEHDKNWVSFFEEGKEGDYSINLKLLDTEEVEYKGYNTLSYKNIIQELDGHCFELVVVDGPFGSEHYSRSQAINIAQHNLSERFCIIIDDYERIGEQETVDEIKNILNNKGVDFCSAVYCSSKEHIVICSSNLRFLASM